MKKAISLAMFLAAFILFAACGNSATSERPAQNEAVHDPGSSAQVSSTATRLKDDKLNAVYQHYIHLTTALTNNDSGEAKIAANAIEAGAKEISSKLAAAAARISAANDIASQRTAYGELSNEMIGLVKASGLKGGQLYVDYCPMALNDKGASWLSAKEDIKNPYMGKQMLECGEVKETIK